MSKNYGGYKHEDAYYGGSSSTRGGGGSSDPYASGSRSGYSGGSGPYSTSPSGYSDQIDEDGHYKSGSQIETDYLDYKKTWKTASFSSTAYWRESKNRDRSKPPYKGTRVDEQWRPTVKDNREIPEWTLMKQRGFYRDDHEQLEPFAHDSSNKYKQYVIHLSLRRGATLITAFVSAADKRAEFNTTYGKVLRKYGDYSTHESEEMRDRQVHRDYSMREDIHRRYKN